MNAPVDDRIAAPSSSVAPLDLAARAFDLTLTLLPPTEPSGCTLVLGPLSLHVVSATPTRLEAIFGSPGEAAPATFDWDGSGWQLASPLVHNNGKQTLTDTVLRFTDSNSDGAFEVSGSGTEQGEFLREDVWCRVTSGVRIAGGHLTRTPRWWASADVDPLRSVWATTDPPLAGDATAAILLPGGASVPMLPRLSNGLVVGFSSDVIYAFDQELMLVTTGAPLGTTSRPAPLTIRTPADPGVRTSLDFEDGGMGAVSGYLAAPAISGQRSALVKDGRLVMHLARPPGATSIVLNARRIAAADFQCTGATFYANAGVVGGTDQSLESVPVGDTFETTVNDVPFTMGSVAEIRLPLRDPGPDAVLVVEHRPGGHLFNISMCAPGAALIDDVRLE